MNFKILSGNKLKIIAAISMFIDHMGILIFPEIPIFRIIGRLAFPIFAFMISEGARYTKNKNRYLLSVFILSVICQIAYIIAGGFEPFNILITFSFSILLIYLLNDFKTKIFSKKHSNFEIMISLSIFLISVTLLFLLTQFIVIDYGFAGCLAPVAASLFDFKGIDVPEKYKRLDTTTIRIFCLFIPVCFIILRNMNAGDYFISPFLLTSMPLLLLYSGKRGTARLKYFFYIFYPLHLIILEGIYLLIFTI